VEYTVQPGDTLWAIAERFYGTGTEFPRLVAANVGRDMPDGGRFTRAGVIRPGWPLAVPLPSRAVEVVDGQRYYIVEEGDSLRGIAARLLGDEARWPEIFDVNRDTARLTDGRTLIDPDLIWPGLRLRLPSSSPEVVAEPPEEAALVLEPSTVAEPEWTPTPLLPPEESTAENGREPGTIATPGLVIEPAPTPTEDGVPPVVYGAAGLAAAAVAGGAALLVRRRVRRSLSEPPVRPPPRVSGRLGNGFAEAEPVRAFTHRLYGGEMELAQVVAEHVLRFLAQEGLTEVAIVAARQERNAVALTLSAGLAEQSRLLELAGQFGTRLGVASEATLTPDYDVLLRVSGLKAAGLMAPPTSRPADPPWLLPLGVLPSRETLYANWRELEHVLVAGLPGGGTETVLASLLAALTARCRPDELRLWTIASRRTLPAQLLDLPHQHGEVVDPTDEVAVGKILEEVRAELTRRMRDAATIGVPDVLGTHKEPELVLVIGELAELEDDGTTLEIVGTQGSAYGVRLLAATTQPEALGDDVLAHFDTRLVLQTLDEDQSIHVLGQPDAADLAGGELLARIDGRASSRARGFRVSADHLDELVRLMREAYGSRSWGAAPWPTGDASTDTEAHSWDALNEEPPPPPAEGFSARAPGSHRPETTTERQCRVIDPSEAEEDSGPDGPQPAPPDRRAGQFVAEETVATTGVTEAEPLSSEPLSRPAREAQGPAPASELPAAGGTRDKEQPSGQQHVESVATVAVAAPDPVADRDAATPEMRSLLQVQCFGPFVVRSSDREISPTGNQGGQFKAWEMLAFLAAQPAGAAPRDKLLAAGWPSVDVERATNRMRVAMARLRAVLAEQVPGLRSEVVRAERDGTCRLDTTLVAVDVHQFLALCRAARKLPPAEARVTYERALALYQGDLLADRSYEWIDERDDSGLSPRERYREEYYQATQQLARLYYQEGHAALAVPLYKRLLKAEPTLEDVVRDLYRCYQQLGDLSSLIREDRHLRRALREAYYEPDDPADDPELYQPEPETIAVFKEVFADLEMRTPTGGQAGLPR